MKLGRLPRVVALATAVLLGGATLAHAAFNSGATATQTISTLTVGAPTGLTGSSAGHTVNLSWTAGANATATQLAILNNGTSSSCPTTGYTNLASTAAATYADARSTPQGTWECYQATSTHGSWTSATAASTAVQLGVVARSVAIANGGTSGHLDSGDTITITFNQAITTTTGPATGNTVCTTTTGTDTIVLGSTGTGTTCSTTQYTAGTLTGLTISQKARIAATWTWSAGNTVLTVKLGALSSGTTPTLTGTTATLTPATGMQSATGAFAVCAANTGGANCLPAATNSF